MKKTNKKGFTLVELVIVIAVIAILAGVMIGTFATVLDSANKSKALQEWRAAVDSAYLDYVADYHVEPDFVEIANGTIKFKLLADVADTGYFIKDSKYVVLDEKNSVYLNRASAGFTVSNSKAGDLADTVEFYKWTKALTKETLGTTEIKLAVERNAKTLTFSETLGAYTLEEGKCVPLNKENATEATIFLIVKTSGELEVVTGKVESNELTVDSGSYEVVEPV